MKAFAYDSFYKLYKHANIINEIVVKRQLLNLWILYAKKALDISD
jgi:hypothetical protein